MGRAGLSIGTSCQTWSPRGARRRGGDRQDRRSRGEPEQRPAACLVAAPRAPETDWRQNKNAVLLKLHAFTRLKPQREESTLDVPTYPRRYAVMMKMLETFLVLLCFDKLLLRYLLTSAQCAGAEQVSPAVLLSLTPCLSLSPIFPSLTCVISFFTPTSLPPLLLTFSPFSSPSCSLHPFHYFGSIHLITLHLLSTLGSPTYSPPFPHLIHFHSLCF